MPLIRANGIELYYEEYGRGDPLLFMAATGWPGSVWKLEQVPYFERHFRVIVYDQRGVGRSEKADHEYSVELLADDALGLLRAIGAEPAHVFGFSMGGRAAQVMALKSPHSVRGLILAGASPGRGEARDGIPMHIALGLGEHGYGLEFWLDHFMSRDFPFSPAFRKQHPQKVRALAERLAADQPPLKLYLRHVLARGTHGTAERLKEIRAPALVMVGSGDHGAAGVSGDHVESARFLAEMIPNAELALVEGAHHLFPWEAPEETNRIVLEFVRRRTAGSTGQP
jgi:pimeloyl-ACP methyl ester carboxylesterase